MTIMKQDDIINSSSPNQQQEEDIIVHAETIDDMPVPTLVSSEMIYDATSTSDQAIKTDLVLATNAEPKDEMPVAEPAATSAASKTTDAEPMDVDPTNEISEPNLDRMKRRRLRSQTTVGWVAGVTGFVFFGIPGAIVGGIAGNKITKYTMKRKETAARNNYKASVAQENVRKESLIAHAVVA